MSVGFVKRAKSSPRTQDRSTKSRWVTGARSALSSKSNSVNNGSEVLTTKSLLKIERNAVGTVVSDRIGSIVQELDIAIGQAYRKEVEFDSGTETRHEYYDLSRLQSALKKVGDFLSELYTSSPLKKQISKNKLEKDMIDLMSNSLKRLLYKLEELAVLHSKSPQGKEIQADVEQYAILKQVRGKAQNILLKLVGLIDPQEARRMEAQFNLRLTTRTDVAVRHKHY